MSLSLTINTVNQNEWNNKSKHHTTKQTNNNGLLEYKPLCPAVIDHISRLFADILY